MSRLGPEAHLMLNESVVDALHCKQIFTVSDFLNAETKLLTKITRLTFKEIIMIRKDLIKKYSATSQNGFDYYKITLKNNAIIPTGISSIDHLLEGGLFTGNIYEVCGLPAAGKTQFCLSLIKNVALNMKQSVCFVDTKTNFVGSRMRTILNGHSNKAEIENALKRILVKRLVTKFDLLNSLYELKNDLEKEILKLRLIIIDSLPIILLNSASSDNTESNVFINHLANVMRFISSEHYVVLLVTNLITTWSEGDFKSSQEVCETIACGKYWSSIPNTRIKIEKDKSNEKCILSILKSDSISVRNDNVIVSLTDKGLM